MFVYLLTVDDPAAYKKPVGHVVGVYSSKDKALEDATALETLRVHPELDSNYTVTLCKVDTPVNSTLFDA